MCQPVLPKCILHITVGRCRLRLMVLPSLLQEQFQRFNLIRRPGALHNMMIIIWRITPDCEILHLQIFFQDGLHPFQISLPLQRADQHLIFSSQVALHPGALFFSVSPQIIYIFEVDSSLFHVTYQASLRGMGQFRLALPQHILLQLHVTFHF